MNILVVCQYYKPEPFKISDLCAELVLRGHQITVLTGIPNYPEGNVYTGYRWYRKYVEMDSGVKVIRVPIIPRKKSKILLMLNYISFIISGTFAALLLNRKFDCVFVYQLSPVFMAIPGIAYSKIKKVPLYIYVLDLWPESFLEIEQISNYYIEFIVRKISQLIYMKSSKVAVSSKGFIELIKKMGYKKKIKYIPQFSDDPERYNLTKNFKKNNELKNFQIIFAGNVGYAQGLETMIEAASITQKINNKIHWLILGDGRAKKKLMNECNVKNINVIEFKDRVSFLDACYEIKNSDASLLILSKSHLFSLTEPAKLQTYLACGSPVLCAIEGETARIIKEANAGVIVSMGNANELAIKAIELSMESQQLDTYSKNARRYYLENYTREKHTQRILEFLSKED
jgi:glycosyltransferase involved in cell wall biosynthesis